MKLEMIVSNHDNVYNTEVQKTKTTFSGLQFNVGIAYPIFKKVDFTFALQFQSNKIDEELNWQKQMGLRSGLRYKF